MATDRRRLRKDLFLQRREGEIARYGAMASGSRIGASIRDMLAFVAMALLAYRYGSDAQAAAEAEVARQGDPPHLLDRARVNVRESGAELALPLGIALALAVLGTLNLAGSGTARVATWTFQPPLLVAGGFVTAGQVFAVRFV